MNRGFDWTECGFIVTGRNALSILKDWCSYDTMADMLENNYLYQNNINNYTLNMVFMPESNPDEIVEGKYACWQKALLDLLCYAYDDSAADEAVYEFMDEKDAVEWCEWMDNHPGAWERLKKEQDYTRWMNHLLYMAGRSDVDEF